MRQIKIKKETIKYLISATGAIVAVVIFTVTYLSIAPSDFPQRKIVTIKSGMYLSQAADLLASQDIIRSPFLFKIYSVMISGHKQIKAGKYLFDKPESSLRIAYRAVNGVQGLPKIKITVFEGTTANGIGNTIKKSIPSFDRDTFVALAKPYEGYLFPDTYFLYEDAESKEVVELLRDTFNQKIKTVLLDIQAFGRPLDEVITMASLIEREASNSEDRRVIAGILWKRISAGMPLQVDAPFYYLLGKESSQLTKEDLAMNSAFNLYKNTGLPPTPITNPGLSAIMDTVNPMETNFWYYLADSKGTTHYATTHDGHVANKRKYIP